MRKISIIHPSRGRAQQAYDAAFRNAQQCKGLCVDYILSIDTTDPELSKYFELFKGYNILVSNNYSAIQAINRAAKVVEGDIFFVMSDDFDFPHHWDIQLLEALEGKSDFVVKTNDGLQDWIITLPIMDRVYYNRFGYIYHPGYSHMFCDTEMTHVADLLGRKITLPIKFPHNHYTTGINPKDAINVKNDATWNQGEALYLERMKNNFGLGDLPQIEFPKSHYNWLRSKGVLK